MKQVDREALFAFVKLEDLRAKMTECHTFSVAQYFDKDGELRAQAVYRPGVSSYMIGMDDPTLPLRR